MRAALAALLLIPALALGAPEALPPPPALPPAAPARAEPLPPPAPLSETEEESAPVGPRADSAPERGEPLPPPAPLPETEEESAPVGPRADSAPERGEPAAAARTVDAYGGPAQAEAPPAPAEAPLAPESSPSKAEERPAAAVPERGKEAARKAAAGESSDFVKGELSSAGVGMLVVRRSRAILGVGYQQIDHTQYAQAYPQLALRLGQVNLAVGAPLNFEVYSSAYPKDASAGQNHILGFKNAGALRKEDWDEVSEYARVLTYLTYGKKEDRFYLDIGQTHVSTLGNGTLMRRYAPSIDIHSTRVAAQVDASNDHGGFEAMTNDIMLWNVVGLLGFVKPLSLLGGGGASVLAKSLSLGATVAVDRSAPTSLQFQPEPACPFPGQCTYAARVPALDDKNRLVANRQVLAIGGVDLEATVVKTDWVDVKPYLDYSHFLSGSEGGHSGGGGLTLGVLGRFNAGERVRHAFRIVAEVRFLGAGYQSGYFDTFYEVDKLLIDGTGRIKSGSGMVPLTKWQATAGASLPDGDSRGAGLPARTGYYLEASWGVPNKVGVTFALDGDSSGPAKNFLGHLELPLLESLQLFASLYVRSFENFGTLFRLDSHSVAFAGLRAKLLPILFVNARAYRTFELDALKTSTGPLGTLQYVGATGLSGGVELGWEF
jgi:hypothetical protein